MATTILRISRARTSPTQRFFALSLEFFVPLHHSAFRKRVTTTQRRQQAERDYVLLIALSMIASPSANCSCVMTSGGSKRSV